MSANHSSCLGIVIERCSARRDCTQPETVLHQQSHRMPVGIRRCRWPLANLTQGKGKLCEDGLQPASRIRSYTTSPGNAFESTKLPSRVPAWPELRLAKKASSRRWTCHSERSQFADDYDRASWVTLILHQSGYLGSQQSDKKANDYVPTPSGMVVGTVGKAIIIPSGDLIGVM